MYFKEDMFEMFGKDKNNQTVILAEANESWLMHNILKILIKDTRYKKIIVRQGGKTITIVDTVEETEYACQKCGSKWCHGDLCR